MKGKSPEPLRSKTIRSEISKKEEEIKEDVKEEEKVVEEVKEEGVNESIVTKTAEEIENTAEAK